MSLSSPRTYDHSDFPLPSLTSSASFSSPSSLELNSRSDNNNMYVIKRNGKKEPVSFDKISIRNESVGKDLNIDVSLLTQKVTSGLISGMSTREIDALSCLKASYLGIYMPDYEILAARILFNDLQKSVPDFLNMIRILNEHPLKLITDEIKDFVIEHQDRILREMNFERDNLLNLFSGATLKNSYLRDIDGILLECPQHFFMREALGVWGPDLKRIEGSREGNIEEVIACYHAFSQLFMTHATPTLTHAGSLYGCLASCYLQTVDDNLNSWADSFREAIFNSKGGGGIDCDLSTVRGNRAPIAGGTGFSNGIIPLMKIFNEISVAISQHDGKRRGSIALTLTPHHPDILAFLQVRLSETPENLHTLDAFPSLMCPSIFFKRIEHVSQAIQEHRNPDDVKWSTFCPATYPELNILYGEEFEQRYLQLEREGKYWKQYPMTEILKLLTTSHIKTGLPYVSNRDSINNKSNQKNIGPVNSSNLCQEIVQFHSSKSTATCNLASLCFPKFVKRIHADGKAYFDFALFREIVRMGVKNLNRVVDSRRVASESGVKNSLDYRAIGYGCQGLADLFLEFLLAWEDKEAAYINRIIWECFYFYAYEMSNELSKEKGPYSAFAGSPASLGIFHHDMCTEADGSRVVPKTHFSYDSSKDEEMYQKNPNSPLYHFETPKLDWERLRSDIKQHGLRNSLLLCVMPSGQTSQLTGNSECIQPYESNLYSRKVAVGNYMIRNKYLYKELKEGGWMKDPLLWKEMINTIIKRDGSVQSLTQLPADLRRRYKTVRELPQSLIIDLAADRQSFIDQSQSMNIFMTHPTPTSLCSMYVRGYKRGLKTILYYLHSSATKPVQYSISENKALKGKKALKNTEQKMLQAESIPVTEEEGEQLKTKELEGVELLILQAEQKECSLKNKQDCVACQ
jgi:ribonucleoside-diphosphate reductase alpha subunit